MWIVLSSWCIPPSLGVSLREFYYGNKNALYTIYSLFQQTFIYSKSVKVICNIINNRCNIMLAILIILVMVVLIVQMRREYLRYV